ncbi:phage tail protein [Pseudolactococcus reticulitermitis]|uniref:Uncharacterized protein n=1 Tax=Pseudolactococcus reticulitermitis TaxID=2025039 RepID=A0A224X999_9LACT|nr:hypothetical protein [Lactococcus reticulitermitis]GAX46764.1 hypothetical protein RsY01_343 [Lactococcus reticulitermitis]
MTIKIDGIEMTFDFKIEKAIGQMQKMKKEFAQMVKGVASNSDAKKLNPMGGMVENVKKSQKSVKTNIDKIKKDVKEAQYHYNQAEKSLKLLQKHPGMAHAKMSPKGDPTEKLNADARDLGREGKAKAQKQVLQLSKAWDRATHSMDKYYDKIEASETKLKAFRSAQIGNVNGNLASRVKQKGGAIVKPDEGSRFRGNINAKSIDNATKRTMLLSRAQSQLKGSASSASSKISAMGGIGSKSMGVLQRGANLAKGGIGRLGSSFANLKSKISGANKAQNSLGRGHSAWAQSLRSMLPALVVYQLLSKAIMSLVGSVWSALKANGQFSASLNQVQANLYTAFYPIYTAILPAINVLMSALATFTGQFASFIATVFGTTYDAAKQGASGLYGQVQAMNDTGSAAGKAKDKADELKRSLMGFDQINRIGLDDKSDDDSGGGAPGGIDFDKATGTYTTPKWMLDLLEDVKSIAKRLWAPIAAAWDTMGGTVIASAKRLFSTLTGIFSDIGRDFMKVWENGSGQKLFENIFQGLADIMDIISDVGQAFRDAWNDNGLGVSVIQSAFDALNSVLELLHEVKKSFSKAWNDGTGKQIMTDILNIVKDVNNFYTALTTNIKKAWQENGTGDKLMKNILKTVQTIIGFFAQLAKSSADFAKTLNWQPMLEGISNLVSGLNGVLSGIGTVLMGIYEKVVQPIVKVLIEAGLPAIFNLLGGALKVVGGALKLVWKFIEPVVSLIVGVAVQGIKDLSGTFSFLGEILSVVGELLSGFADWFNWGKIIDGAKEIIDGFATWFGEIWEGIKTAASDAWTAISDKTSEIWNGITEFFSGVWDGITSTVSTALETAKTTISDGWDKAKEATSNAWDGIKSGISGAWDSIKEKTSGAIENVKEKASTGWQNIKEKTSGAWSGISGAVSGAWSGIQSTSSSIMGSIGSSIQSTWNSFTSFMTNPIENAKNAISGIIESIKGLFNIDLKFPDIHIPQFHINPSGWSIGDLMKGEIPSLSFYAKGTQNHGGGLAVVNDAKSNLWREAYKTPNGSWKMFPNIQNMLVDLPKGTQVMAADKIPHFAEGTQLMMPDLFSASKIGTPGKIGNLNNGNDETVSLLKLILNAILNGGAKQDGNGDIIINIGGNRLIKILASEIKKYERQTGQSFISI